MITKVSFGVAIALSVSIATANPAGAEPSPFSVLSCSCEGGAPVSYPGPTMREQIDAGIAHGLTELLGNPG